MQSLLPARSQYLVKRKGLDLSACGLVDARAAKRQRMALAAPVTQHPGEADQAPDDAPPACPVTLAMMDEFDAFSRSFQCAVHAHSEDGELDLGALPTDSGRWDNMCMHTLSYATISCEQESSNTTVGCIKLNVSETRRERSGLIRGIMLRCRRPQPGQPSGVVLLPGDAPFQALRNQGCPEPPAAICAKLQQESF